VAVSKFFHTVLSGWVLGAIFVIGVSAWYLLRKREVNFALDSMRMAAGFGLVAALLVAFSGDISGVQMAREQPMKLAAAEGLRDGGRGVGFTVIGDIKIPKMLSILATHDIDGYVPGINNLLNGDYPLQGGGQAMPVAEKIARGQRAIMALAAYRQAKEAGDEGAVQEARRTLELNIDYLGYGYIKDPARLIPPLNITFWAFRIMVGLGGYFILFFLVLLFFLNKKKLSGTTWLQYVALWTIPLAYIAGQAGWVVAEVGRQPWAIQDMLPVEAAVSRLSTGTVQVTFFIFLLLFTVMLAAEINIMCKMIRKGPESLD
jgi:cytochrome d ubiquinol oxidase subunit I